MIEPHLTHLTAQEESTLWASAQRREREGDLMSAANTYAALLEHRLDHGRPIPSLLCDRLGAACTALELPKAAVRILASARACMRQLGDSYGVLRMTVKLAQVCLGAVALADAERFLADALFGALTPLASGNAEAIARARVLSFPGARADDTAAARVDACLTLARLWAATGRFNDAIAAAEAARACLLDGAEEFFSRADIGLFIAELHLDRGDTRAALAEEKLSRPRLDRAETPDRDLDRWDALAAHRALIDGRLSGARQLLERIAMHSASPFTRTDLQVALALASVLGRLNRLAEAERILEQTEARLGEDTPHRSWLRSIRSLAYLLQQKRAGAARDRGLPFVPEQVLRTHDEDGDEARLEGPNKARDMPTSHPLGSARERRRERFADEWALRANELLLDLDPSNLDAASARLDALEELTRATDAPRLRARARYFRALIGYYRKDYDAAAEELSACLEASRALSAPLDQLQYLELLSWVHARLDRGDAYRSASARAKAQFDAVLASLDAEDRVYLGLNRMSQQDHFIAARLDELEAIPRPSLPLLRLADWVHASRRRRAVLSRYREVACLSGWEIDRHLTPTAELPADELTLPPHQANASDQIEAWVRTELALARGGARDRRPGFLTSWWPLFRIPRGTALIHYYAVADRLFAFVLTRGRIALHEVPTTRVELYEGVRGVIDEAHQQFKASVSARRVNAALLRLAKAAGVEAIFAPLLGTVERVVVILHDALVHAPFAALPCGDHGRLAERFTVAAVPGPRWFAPRSFTRRASRSPSFLCVGVCDYPGTSLPKLPGALREIAEIATATAPRGASRLLDGPRAQPAAVLKALETVTSAHFACHGEFDMAAPHRSRLYLAGPGETTAPVTLAEIQARDLRRLELVVLSSCWTASTALLPGSEPVCLPAAFLKAGARAVIAPLWQVDDAMSVAFMRDLYAALREHPPVRALAEVQRAWMYRDERGEGMPHHWAAWTFHGAG